MKEIDDAVRRALAELYRQRDASEESRALLRVNAAGPMPEEGIRMGDWVTIDGDINLRAVVEAVLNENVGNARAMPHRS